MATVNWVIEQPQSPAVGVAGQGDERPAGIRVIKWTLANGDVGVGYEAPQYGSKAVQVSGTPGAGGALKIEGTLAPPGQTAVYGTVNKPAGTPLTFAAADVTANALFEILEDCYIVRPSVTAGDGTTSIIVRLLINTTARR